MFTYKIWQSLVLLASLPFAKSLDFKGADYSSLINLENSGITYTDDGTAGKFDAILADNGVNLARIRIWTSTNDEDYSLAYGLELGKRAVDLGMSLLIDLHYSDTWADPGDQAIPSSWPTDLDSLNEEIFTYTNSLVTAFADQGTPIDFLQIGNEINSGILFPVGEISVNGYSPLSQLLNSAASGVREASSTVKIVVHLANGWDGAAMLSFYEQIFIAGEFSTDDFDVMGLFILSVCLCLNTSHTNSASLFFPRFYDTGATYSALQSSLQDLVDTYGKEIMIVETDWPSSGTCDGVTLSEDLPISTTGQEEWISGITDVLNDLDGALGVVYWEPGWIGNDDLGSGCSDNLLVSDEGETLASIVLFADDI
ncbi:glycoside hydrolase family 53 protein [Gymnopus androsaceus JB14]|uniref:Arabinogalactan endo-beta-1,4-galactanase n=1 Tax=Gymnopus androsaceus JB14 TaxID=1447944 RepID=A0A6A4I3V7_9AGAR|nr:glycoside hydrolase family 53 protein [Gymnopus androsaceus JB14]